MKRAQTKKSNMNRIWQTKQKKRNYFVLVKDLKILDSNDDLMMNIDDDHFELLLVVMIFVVVEYFDLLIVVVVVYLIQIDF